MNCDRRFGAAFTLALGVAAASVGTFVPAAAKTIVHSVGAVTWHAPRYAGHAVTIDGYVLRRERGYVLFSDEPGGAISQHDLPVLGAGSDKMKMRVKYRLKGVFVKGGLAASNHNPYHLKLTAKPMPLRP